MLVNKTQHSHTATCHGATASALSSQWRESANHSYSLGMFEPNLSVGSLSIRPRSRVAPGRGVHVVTSELFLIRLLSSFGSFLVFVSLMYLWNETVPREEGYSPKRSLIRIWTDSFCHLCLLTSRPPPLAPGDNRD